MRVFKTKPFERFARKERIADEDLCAAVKRAEGGVLDADLGGGVIKQRLARKGQGRSGGYRAIVAYQGATGQFSYLALPRAIWTTSTRESGGNCKERRRYFWGSVNQHSMRR